MTSAWKKIAGFAEREVRRSVTARGAAPRHGLIRSDGGCVPIGPLAGRRRAARSWLALIDNGGHYGYQARFFHGGGRMARSLSYINAVKLLRDPAESVVAALDIFTTVVMLAAAPAAPRCSAG